MRREENNRLPILTRHLVDHLFSGSSLGKEKEKRETVKADTFYCPQVSNN
jgi:hypothetical protein